MLLNPALDHQTKEFLRVQSRPFEKDFQSPHIWIASSGSTAQDRRDIKLMALSYDALAASAQGVNAHLKVTAADRWLNILPTFHVGGLGIFFRAKVAGIEFINCYQDDYKWDVNKFYSALTQYQSSITSLVPTQIYDLVRTKIMAPNCLRAVVVGGGTLSNELYQKARNLGWPLLASFGMTELCSQIATASLESLSGAEPKLQILKHIQIQTDQDQVLQIRSPALMSLVLKNLNGKLVGEHFTAGSWYKTQDKGLVQNDLLTVLGREDEIVKILGENVNVAFLRSHFETLVLNASTANHAEFKWALVAKDDPRTGKKLVLYFEGVNSEPDQFFSGQKNVVHYEQIIKLQEQFNKSVLPYERIAEVCALKKIPRSDLGKILYGELK